MEESSTLKDCRILVVDDEDGFRDALLRRLRHRGIAAEGVNSGSAGLAWLAENEADIVLLDIQLGDMDGREVLRQLPPCGVGPAVVVLSGHAYTDIALDAMRAGACDYLLKPCPLDELLERLETVYDQLLEKRGA